MMRRRKVGDAGGGNNISQDKVDASQDLIADNLDLMKEVIMRIREDPEFARNIYADCPRLQALLDEQPDLRPIFEDPKLIRLNFEQVYKEQGGVLPEDEKKKSLLVAIVTSPFFKILRFLILAKKIFACITGGGLAILTGCLVNAFCCGDAPLDAIEGGEGDADADDIDDDDLENELNEENKEALNKAADHMEDPEVQEHMQEVLEDPDSLEDAIESDPELRALRDSNPLCAELMSDPETMRILVDPDNLRALGECPDLIEADFADPGYSVPDIETGYDMDVDVDVDADVEVDADADAEADADADNEDGGDEEEGDEDDEEEEEEDEEWWEDAEFEQQETGADAGGGGPNHTSTGTSMQQQRQQQRQDEQKQGILGSVAAAGRDIVAGMVVGELFDGGADFFGGPDVDADVDDAAEALENTVDAVERTDDIADTLEVGMDGIEGGVDNSRTAAVAGGAVAGGAVGTALGPDDSESEEEEEEDKGVIGNFFSAVSTAAKEQIAATFLGDGLGELLVERVEEGKEEEEEESSDEEEEDSDEENGDAEPEQDWNDASMWDKGGEGEKKKNLFKRAASKSKLFKSKSGGDKLSYIKNDEVE